MYYELSDNEILGVFVLCSEFHRGSSRVNSPTTDASFGTDELVLDAWTLSRRAGMVAVMCLSST